MDDRPGSDLTIRCPVCDGEDGLYLREAYDDRYGYPDLFSLVRCKTCGHLMTSPRLNENELPQLYGQYYPRENLPVEDAVAEAAKVGLFMSSLRRWWSGTDNQGQYSARAGDKMLDVGCGNGVTLLEARNLGVEAWGIEADPNVKRFADALDLRIHIGNLYDNPFAETVFDLIVLNQVVEHLPEPDKALELIRSRLSKDGRVILVFPNINSLWCKLSGSRWINWHVPYHLHHFNATTFSLMAERCGFRVTYKRTITPNVWTILQLRASRQNIVRGEQGPIWTVRFASLSENGSVKARLSIRGL